MGRQLFLHHYLPAHLASSLVTGAVLEFIFSVDAAEPVEAAKDIAHNKKRKHERNQSQVPMTAKERLSGQSLLPLWAASGVLISVVIFGWWFFLPLTYGKPGLSVAEVNARKWLNYDLHFAK